MSTDPETISRLKLSFKNLVITGFLGVGKTTIGRQIARRLGVGFLDIDEEIELRELMSISKLRELYGVSRLRALEHDYCRQGALMRRAVIVAPGAALLDKRNFDLLNDTGMVVVLTCELGEALRRLHLANSQQFRDATLRHRMISRLRREYEIINIPQLPQLDTTELTIEQEVDLLINFWSVGEPDMKYFRQGPKPPIRPPGKMTVGLSRPQKTGS